MFVDNKGQVVVEEPWDCLVVATAGVLANQESGARIYGRTKQHELPLAVGGLVARDLRRGLEQIIETGQPAGYDGFLTPAIAAGYLERISTPAEPFGY